jgi:hypothetical protein
MFPIIFAITLQQTSHNTVFLVVCILVILTMLSQLYWLCNVELKMWKRQTGKDM